MNDIGCVAVHHTPGLVGALLVGVTAAKALSLALGVPLVGVNHVAGHVFACRLAAGRDIFPCVGLVVSGGHTALFRCDTALSLDLLGGTRDDAAGEAFDKVAALLGLGFPGGPAVEREAALGNPKAHRFPRTFLDTDRLEAALADGVRPKAVYVVPEFANPTGATLTATRRRHLASPRRAHRRTTSAWCCWTAAGGRRAKPSRRSPFRRTRC